MMEMSTSLIYKIEAKATPGIPSPKHHPDPDPHADYTVGRRSYVSPGSLDLLKGKGGYSEEIVVKYDIKRLSSWFYTWKTWQKRLLICSVVNCCTKQQLMMLATSMEPLLHMDFCSTLLPPFQSLHLDGIAVFHNTRIITHRCTEPEIIPKIDSQAYLNSLPSTFLSKSSVSSIPPPSSSHLHHKDQVSPKRPFMNPKKDIKNESKKKREPILPALPLTHPKHLPTPGLNREPSFHQLLGQRRQRFSSVPDFHSTMGLLKNSRKRWNEHRRSHMKRKTISTYFTQPLTSDHRAEEFKGQLAQWMVSWEEVYRSHLLSELVKLCDKDLLGYFVQCLHQQLASTLGIHSLPDSSLNMIFQYLNPKELCTASQVCKHWNLHANTASLWKRHTYMLGMAEGVGNVGEVMEAVIDHYKHSLRHVSEDDSAMVDWKRAYRDFDKLLDSMKDLVIRTAGSAGSSEIEERLKSSARCHTARNKLSLLEMLDILRLKTCKPNITTNELYRMAPESVTATRHRLRAEKKKEEFEKLETIISQDDDTKLKKVTSPMSAHVGAWTPTHNLEFARNLMMGIRETDPEYCKFLGQLNLNLAEDKQTTEISEEFIDRLEIAQEIRPKAPHWPNPKAVYCMVLAGALLHRTPRPGQILDIPKLRRLENVLSVILCMQCDSRKIIVGSLNRTITVIDIRSGRPVSMLHGHKGSVQCLQYDDYKIVSGSWDTSCIVWDIVHFKMLKQLNGHSECVSCLHFDTDILVSGSYDGSLRVWSTSNWETRCIMSSAHPGGVLCLKLNGKIIASGGIDHEVKIWSSSSFHCLKVLSHTSPVTTLAISHLLLISCSIDGAVIVWDINSYNSMMRLRTINGAHMRQLAQFHTKFYGAGSDGVVYELDISTGTCLRTLKGHNMIITAIYVVDHKLVSTSADKTIVTWQFQKPVTSKTREKVHAVKVIVEDVDPDEDTASSSTLTNVDMESGKKEEYQYQAPKFYADFHMRHVMGTGPDCCGFVYEH